MVGNINCNFGEAVSSMLEDVMAQNCPLHYLGIVYLVHLYMPTFDCTYTCLGLIVKNLPWLLLHPSKIRTDLLYFSFNVYCEMVGLLTEGRRVCSSMKT